MHCPKEIQRALTRAGGERLNGDPNYQFMWSAEFTYLISNGRDYEPYRVVAEDCWLLVKYELPEFWGSEAEWEIENWESGSKERVVNGIVVMEPLYTAGPYPHRGRYRNIMRIQKSIVLDGERYMQNCAPTLQWVSEFFPGVRDFLDLSVEEKAKYIEAKDKAQKEALSKGFQKTRANYKGIATATQIKQKEEALERWVRLQGRVN